MPARLKQLKYAVPICIFFVFTVVFYGPLSLYLPNSEEFWFSLGTVLKTVVPFSAAALLILLVFFLALPEKAGGFFRKLLFGGALGLYIQGNYINITYGDGVLDGSAIPWEQYRTYGIINTTVWIICLLLPFVLGALLKRKKGSVSKLLVIASLFLTVIQIPALISQAVSYRPNQNADITISREGMMDLSRDENVMIFLLDTMDEAYYQAFLEEQPAFTDQLYGFVHYENTLASGARTPVAVPSMFTGVPFTRQESYSNYKQKVWSAPNSLSVLHDAGYDVGFYSEAILFSDACAQYLTNFSTDGIPIGSHKIFLKKLYKLDLFKFLPHVLKKYVWMDTAEFDEAIDQSDEGGMYLLNDFRFFEVFRRNGFSGDAKQKAVRIYHLRGAHNPYTMDQYGVQSKEATLKTQVNGVLSGVLEMLNALKADGFYDNTTIILTADHGDLNKAERPFFLVKEAGSKGAYRTSDAPVSMFDLAVYLAELAGKPLDGQTYGIDFRALEERGQRERHFFRHEGESNNTAIEEYKSAGDASDEAALQLIQTYEGSGEPEERYELGTSLSFGVEATGNQYATEGFAGNTGMRTALRGPVSEMQIPFEHLPKKGALKVLIDFNKPTGQSQNYTLVVEANGTEVFNDAMTHALSQKGLAFEVPVSLIGEDKLLTLDFRFPEISDAEMKQDVSKRTSTVRFISMRIDPA